MHLDGIKIKFNQNDFTYKASIHSDIKIMLKPLDYFVTDIPLALASVTNIPVYVKCAMKPKPDCCM